MSKKLLDFTRTHVFGMTFVMKQNETLDPIDLSLFGADAVMFETNFVANLIE
jgi:hypothetical protein